jgi:hypothetical protein
MRKSLFALAICLCFSQLISAQVSHLSLVYDIEGEDFDYPVHSMYGVNDSLYVFSYTPDFRGQFYRIDGNGEGFHLIHAFNGPDYGPCSISGSDTAIYLTTHNTPALFKYSFKDYSFTLVKQFDYSVGGAIQLKNITDDKMWFTSQGSPTDITSIFTTDLNGNNVDKIYTAHNEGTDAFMISDLFFHDDKIYAAFYGGGELDSHSVYSGSFGTMDLDGSDFKTIIAGREGKGTQPQSLLIRDNKIFGMFAYNTYYGAQFFISNLDGTEYDSLGGIPDRALTRMLETDSLIYAFAGLSIVGINPDTREIRVSEDLLSNPDFGYDVGSSPAYLNGNVYVATMQGGPGGGGTILKWTNEPPAVNIGARSNGRLSSGSVELDLNTLFTDANGDEIEHAFRYNSNLVTMNKEAGVVTLTPQVSETVEVTIIARDGWAGYGGALITLNPFSITALDPKLITGTPEDAGDPSRFLVYPNPAYNELRFNKKLEAVDILSADGKVRASYRYPGDSIDISPLQSGLYFVRGYVSGRVYVQKLIKL